MRANSFMEVVGYALIKGDADLKFCMGDKDDWQGKIVRVMEFNDNSKSVLAISNSAIQMGMFEYSDMERYFKCFLVGDVLVPPTAKTFVDRTLEANKRLSRNGGYNKDVQKMVIANSLAIGKFDDKFLF